MSDSVTPEQARELLYGDKRRGGRRTHRHGVMNKTEQRYADEVLEPLFRARLIHSYHYEALTIKLANDLRITPDFTVIGTMNDEGRSEIVLIDVKGAREDDSPYLEDDALVKLKMLADKFCFRVKVVWPSRHGDWKERHF